MKDGNEKTSAAKKEIEALARERGLDAALVAGVMSHKGWASGKSISEKEFDSALKDFLSARAG